jgi:predicted nucleotidyltransferase
MVNKKLLDAFKRKLVEHYGKRLKGVVLYGSEARGEADDHSDVDLMVLLDGPVDTGREIREITGLIYPLQMEQGFFRPVEVIPVDVKDYRSVNIGIYRNVKEEGISL